MTLTDALSALHRAGYRAYPSPVIPGYISVSDPVYTYTGGNLEPRTAYETRTVHPSRVWHFINERD